MNLNLNTLEKNLNALLIIMLSVILLSAYGVQFIYHEQPCPLCLLQRLGMISVACCAVLNLWFGIRMSNYGLILISCIYGGFVALRQISLHVCPGFPSFGIPVLGLSLYTWSFVVFVCIVLYTAMMLLIHEPKSRKELIAAPSINVLGKIAIGLILFVVVANIISTFAQCGFGECE